MAEYWHKLRKYESHDLVESGYYSRHGLRPKASRIRAITANFVQAREYFRNASRADISVSPLLFYYGSLALSRGVILYCSTAKGPEALKPSHGLFATDWAGTLSKGLDHFEELRVTLRSGTMMELLDATENKGYFKHNSSAINFAVPFPKPLVNSHFCFADIISALPELSDDFSDWKGDLLPSLPVDSITLNIAEDFASVMFRPPSTLDRVMQVFQQPYKTTGSGVHDGKVWINLGNGVYPLFAQSASFGFGVGNLHLIPPINGGIYLNPLSILFAGSYFLGMVVRYFPSTWLDLTRQAKGDGIVPIVLRILSLIELNVPESVLHLLEAPYPFEKQSSRQKPSGKPEA